MRFTANIIGTWLQDFLDLTELVVIFFKHQDPSRWQLSSSKSVKSSSATLVAKALEFSIVMVHILKLDDVEVLVPVTQWSPFGQNDPSHQEANSAPFGVLPQSLSEQDPHFSL